MLHRQFLFTVTIFIALWGLFLSIPPRNEAEIQRIDKDIEELQDMKRGYEGKALRHEDYAERLQFNNEAHLEARRHIQLAQENRAKADKIQEEIDKLQEKRKGLIGENGTAH